MRSETIEDINVPDISECSVAEKAHYFEEQIQREMAKTGATPRPQDPARSLLKGKPIGGDDQRRRESLDRDAETTKETVEEKHIAESREIEKILKTATRDDRWTRETRKEPKDTDEDRVVREEVQKIIAQPVMEVCKELLNKERELAEGTQVIHAEEERRGAKAELREMLTMPQVETVVTEEKPAAEVVEELAEVPRPESPLRKEVVREKTSGRKIITEETTIIYKVQKDGTLVQEKVLKSVQIEGGEPIAQVPEISVETKMPDKGPPDTMREARTTDDTRTESVPLDVKKTVEQFLEGEKRAVEEGEIVKESELPVKEEASEPPRQMVETVAEQMTDASLPDKKPAEVKQARREFESRIPISAAMAEKDKGQKEARPRTSPEKLDEKLVRSPVPEKKKTPEDIASPSARKKEFESRIPKRIAAEGSTLKERDARKDLPGRKDGETVTVTEKKSSEEVTSRHEERSTTKSTTQTFSKTFTDAQDAFKMFEDMGAMRDGDFATVTSKVDTKASSKIEKKEVVSSEISSGADKIITHEEKEQVERRKSSESKLKKESPAETVEEKTSMREEIDKTATQKLSMNVTEGREVIDARGSESRAESKKEESFRLLENEEGTATEKSGTSRTRESDVDVAIRIKKDETKKVEDTREPPEAAKEMDLGKVEMIAQGQSYKESSDSFKEKDFVPSQKAQEQADLTKKPEEDKSARETLEEREQLVAKEIEARQVAEDLIQSIESEIERRSTSGMKPQMLSKEYLDRLITESSDTDHEKLADDLTRKFESIMKRSQDEAGYQETLSRTSIQEETFEKGYVRDSISISEDITRDEESSLQDREESLPLSSAKLQDRDITMSPSSISEQIDLETIDVDTGELEDISKPTSSPHSEKLRSDRSSGHIEPLQRDSDVSVPKDKVVSEISGARVLEILEPSADSRQDSVDVPSLELDEHKVPESSGKSATSLHESTAVDSLERIAREKDVAASSDTKEGANLDHSPAYELGKVGERRRADSFEIESPPLVSPRTRHLHELEIKPVSWMIGDEKIRVTETVQPYQAFDQELEELIGTPQEVEPTAQRVRSSSQDESLDLEQESATKSSEEISVIESEPAASDVAPAKLAKFTVIPVSESEPELEPEPDFDSELIENKLDVTCQELVDTLQREYDAKTPTDEYAGIRQSVPCEDFDFEGSITEAVTEVIPVEETEDLTEDVARIVESKPCVQVIDEKAAQREVSTTPTVVSEISRKEEEKEETRHIEETQEHVEESTEQVKTAAQAEEPEVPAKCPRVDDVLKEWAETYLSKIKPPSEDYKRHMEKTTEKLGKSAAPISDTCALKIKKDELQNVDLSARYAITVLDQVVKKEIAEVKESLEAAQQDLIEELSENSQTVIKDSPSEFQFKLQPESIPNDLPFLYKPPSTERVPAETEQEARTEPEAARESPKAEEPVKAEQVETRDDTAEDKSEAPIIVEEKSGEVEVTASEIERHQAPEETVIAVHEEHIEDEEEGRPSPLPISRSSDIGSDLDYRDDSYSSLAPPQPAPRRRHKPTRVSKRAKTSDSEADLASSSGESSNYHSCDYEGGSGSRPSSSDVEAMHSAVGGIQSGTASEYETAAMSVEHEGASRTLPTSQEYQTAASTLSSRESLKSLSSGHLGSIDSTSELSETLVPSEEADADQDEIDENLESALDADQGIVEASDSSGSEEIPMDEAVDKPMDKIDSHIPCRMKRSSEMIFQQILDDSVSLEESMDDVLEDDRAKLDSGNGVFDELGPAKTSEDEVQSASAQISTRVTRPSDSEELEEEEDAGRDAGATETGLEQRFGRDESAGDEGLESAMQATSVHSMLQQASMSLSSASGMSFDTVIEKDMDKSERHSDSDSFELVDKPDIIDDFVVIEEVGREAEEFDSEGKSIRISATPQVTSKQYDRDLENLIAETKEDAQAGASTSQAALRNNDLFDFESEESPPQASNDDQYSQSYSDEEQYEGKKWIEMQFHADARVYDTLEYDRGPLEDIKEEEITDFEAGSSRIGSLGSHKESIGSVGSMRGSLGSTPDYDVLGKKFTKPTDHDTVSLTSLQEFEHLESTLAENSRKLQQCGSQDSSNNGSLPKRYMTGRSGHGDDVSLSSLKDFEGLERACREAHLIELRAREEEELLEHESPENKYKMEGMPRSRNVSAAGSVNPSTSGSDDYEKRIKEIDEIIRIAQSNVEKFDRQDDTTEDISQIEITDAERAAVQPLPGTLEEAEEPEDEARAQKEANVMETSTDSLEMEENAEEKRHPLCRSSDSLEMKTTLDFPSLSSDSLNNMRDTRETPVDAAGQLGGGARRISSDSLEIPLAEQQDAGASERSSDSNGHRAEDEPDSTVGRELSTGGSARNGKTRTPPASST